MSSDNIINISICTPNDKSIDDKSDFVVCKTDEGEIGFQINHTPLIGRITKGFIRYNNIYVVILNGIIEFKDNRLTVICQNAKISESFEKGLELINLETQKILSESKRKLVDFTQAERDLALSIKEAKLGKIK